MAASAGYFWWSEDNASGDNRIMRVRKDGSSVLEVKTSPDHIFRWPRGYGGSAYYFREGEGGGGLLYFRKNLSNGNHVSTSFSWGEPKAAIVGSYGVRAQAGGSDGTAYLLSGDL